MLWIGLKRVLSDGHVSGVFWYAIPDPTISKLIEKPVPTSTAHHHLLSQQHNSRTSCTRCLLHASKLNTKRKERIAFKRNKIFNMRCTCWYVFIVAVRRMLHKKVVFLHHLLSEYFSEIGFQIYDFSGKITTSLFFWL